MSKIDLEWLKKQLPKLVRESDEIKGAIIRALSGVVATHKDIKELTKTMDKRFEKMDERFEKMDERFEKMDKRFEKMDKRFEKMDERFEKMDKHFEQLNQRILDNTEILKKMQLGIARIETKEGRNFEKLVRSLLSETLKMEDIDPDKMENVSIHDKKGEVFFPGFVADIDILAKNGNTYAIELKATANAQDIGHFVQIVKLYEHNTGKTVTKKILASLRITSETIRAAEKASVKLLWGEIIDI